MQMKFVGLALAMFGALTGCPSQGNIAVGDDDSSNTPGDNNGPGNGLGNTVGTADPGSGPGAGAYRVQAWAEGRDTFVGNQRFYETNLRVDLRDDTGNDLTGATVRVSTLLFGSVNLVEDLPGNPGRYRGALFGYDRTYSLTVEGPAGRFDATAIGPAAHTLDTGSPVDIGQDWTITWAPSGASFAEINTRGDGTNSINDTGSTVVATGRPDYELGVQGEERVRLTRWEVLDLTGALSNSFFQVEIRIQEEDVDTTDSRQGMVDGAVEVDPDFGDLTGTVYVLAWPEILDPYTSPPWAWTSVVDVPNNDTYTLDLAPGDWLLRAYLDENGSDAGQALPLGPDPDEPYRDRTITIDPNGNRNRDMFLDQRW